MPPFSCPTRAGRLFSSARRAIALAAAAPRYHGGPLRPLLSLAAVAERLGISRQTVLCAIHAGKIHAHEVVGGTGGLVAFVIEPAALEQVGAPRRKKTKQYLSLTVAGARLGRSRMSMHRDVRAGLIDVLEVDGPGGSLVMMVVEEKELARLMRRRGQHST